MIDIDELERRARFSTAGESIRVDRDELLLLINRYRELPDLSPEERPQPAPIPGIRQDAPLDKSTRLARQCNDQLQTAKLDLERLRYSFSLFVDCPDCNVKVGEDCRGQGHHVRLNAGFMALQELRGSSMG